ncbi:MAG: tetratricopeptide repeat protein [Gemmatimonadota bacterium]|nr:MAG: tetratricopeptide repeat protein [Gemmatimonadota bacterium]
MSRTGQLFQELKRRRVFRVAVVYAAVAFVIWQAADFALPALRLPDWVPTLVVVLTLLGFPIAVVLAWAFEITPEGVKRTEGVGDGAAAPRGRGSIIAVTAASALLAAIVAVTWILLSDEAPEDAGPAGREDKLLVLPFENLGPAEDEYFADGVTEAITARLAALEGMGVFSRQTAYSYKGSDKTAQQIGTELGVAYILEGTVQRERPTDPTSRVRITPQLIRVADDTHLWADAYDEEVLEVFRVQSEIAERVARALDVTLLEPERRSTRARLTENVEAYEYYLRGNEHWSTAFYHVTARLATEMYKRAVELDPEFASAQATLARALAFLHFRGLDSDLPMATAALDAAVRLGPDLAEVQMAQAYYLYYATQEFDRAVERFESVLRTQPNNAEALSTSGAILRRQGKWEEGLARIERAVELDPRNQLSLGSLGITLSRMRRYREADRIQDRLIALDPRNPSFYAFKAENYLYWQASIEMARSVVEQASSRAGMDPGPIVAFSPVLVRVLGEEYAEALERLTVEQASDTAGLLFAKAELNARRGNARLANAYYDSARVILPGTVAGRSSGLVRQGNELAVVYGRLGRSADALRTAEAAVDLAPISHDAQRGANLTMDLAEVYMMVGEHDLAIDQLELLLSIPAPVSVPLLRVDPLWDPLRDHPRFQALLAREP